MKKKTCVNCGEELELGKFAYNQDLCWKCFKTVSLDAAEKLNGEERKIVIWMLTLIASYYGCKV